jgi:hypothetical protein
MPQSRSSLRNYPRPYDWSSGKDYSGQLKTSGPSGSAPIGSVVPSWGWQPDRRYQHGPKSPGAVFAGPTGNPGTDFWYAEAQRYSGTPAPSPTPPHAAAFGVVPSPHTTVSGVVFGSPRGPGRRFWVEESTSQHRSPHTRASVGASPGHLGIVGAPRAHGGSGGHAGRPSGASPHGGGRGGPQPHGGGHAGPMHGGGHGPHGGRGRGGWGGGWYGTPADYGIGYPAQPCDPFTSAWIVDYDALGRPFYRCVWI